MYEYDLPEPKSLLQLKRYIKFIKSKINRVLPENTYKESHHILPRSFGGIDENNLVDLTGREHYIAHWMLYKAYKNHAMVSAFMMMHSNNHGQLRYYNSRRYEMLKSEYSESQKITMLGEGNPFYGKNHTKESKKKMSETKKGINTSWNTGLTTETSEKLVEVGKNISKSVKGMRNWTNGTVEAKSKDAPDSTFWIGRLPNENFKFSESRKLETKDRMADGKMSWWNDGTINKRQKDIPEGDLWVKGRLKSSMSTKVLTDKDYLRKYNYFIIKNVDTNEILKLSNINKEIVNYFDGRSGINNLLKYKKHKNYVLVDIIHNPLCTAILK